MNNNISYKYKFIGFFVDLFTMKQCIYYSILFYALSLPISKAGTVFFSILMIILWTLEGNFKDKFHILKNSKFMMLLGGLILVSIISILWSPDIDYSIDFIKKYWHFLVLPVIYTSLDKKDISTVILFFLIGMLISEVFSYAIYFEIITYKNVLPTNPTPFMDHMNYSTYLALTALLLLNKVFFVDKIKYKIFYFIYFLLTVFSLFINGGRTGQIIFVITLFLVSYINVKRKILALVISFVLASSIVSVAYNTSPNFNNRINQAIADVYNITNGDFTGSFGQRVSLWVIGINIFKDNIFIGTGLGNELLGFKFYANKFDFKNYNTEAYDKEGTIDFHNSFVQYAVQLGVGGLILYIMIFLSLFTLKLRSKLYQNINRIFLIVFILHSCVFYSFHLIHPMVLFALFAGLLSVVAKENINRRRKF